MKNKTVTDMHIDELETCDWLTYEDSEGEEHFIRTDEDVNAAAKIWKVNPAMVKSVRTALDFMVSAIVLDLKDDLQDIWNMSNCAHDNALTAMAILNGGNGDGHGDDDDSDDDEPPSPNPDDCGECEQYNRVNNTCKLYQ